MNADAHHGLGHLRALKGDYIGAEQEFRKAIRFDSKLLPAYASLIAALLKRQKKVEADKVFLETSKEFQGNTVWNNKYLPFVQESYDSYKKQ